MAENKVFDKFIQTLQIKTTAEFMQEIKIFF